MSINKTTKEEADQAAQRALEASGMRALRAALEGPYLQLQDAAVQLIVGALEGSRAVGTQRAHLNLGVKAFQRLRVDFPSVFNGYTSTKAANGATENRKADPE